jgi:hypothetical protein
MMNCEICGEALVYEECDFCGGTGYENVFFVDHALVFDGDDEVECLYCDGDCGWWVCPNVSRHPVLNSEQDEQEQPHAG